MNLDVVKVKFAIVLFECWVNKELGYIARSFAGKKIKSRHSSEKKIFSGEIEFGAYIN